MRINKFNLTLFHTIFHPKHVFLHFFPQVLEACTYNSRTQKTKAQNLLPNGESGPGDPGIPAPESAIVGDPVGKVQYRRVHPVLETEVGRVLGPVPVQPGEQRLVHPLLAVMGRKYGPCKRLNFATFF